MALLFESSLLKFPNGYKDKDLGHCVLLYVQHKSMVCSLLVSFSTGEVQLSDVMPIGPPLTPVLQSQDHHAQWACSLLVFSPTFLWFIFLPIAILS